jgi:hypothetical protein
MKRFLPIIFSTLIFYSCGFTKFQDDANTKFADQHFKTAIANIELYNIRYGEYPASLESLDFLGDWDIMIFNSVSYQKLENGYQLDVVNGSEGNLEYPNEFWQGLGIKKSNILK